MLTYHSIFTEGCACCNAKDCRTCKYATLDVKTERCNSCLRNGFDGYESVNFCIECGKPLTDAGLKRLEKRLGVGE